MVKTIIVASISLLLILFNVIYIQNTEARCHRHKHGHNRVTKRPIYDDEDRQHYTNVRQHLTMRCIHTIHAIMNATHTLAPRACCEPDYLKARFSIVFEGLPCETKHRPPNTGEMKRVEEEWTSASGQAYGKPTAFCWSQVLASMDKVPDACCERFDYYRRKSQRYYPIQIGRGCDPVRIPPCDPNDDVPCPGVPPLTPSTPTPTTTSTTTTSTTTTSTTTTSTTRKPDIAPVRRRHMIHSYPYFSDRFCNMGNKSSLMLQDGEIKQIGEETGFSSVQIEKLYARFAHLDRSSCGSLNKNDLMSIPELAINPLCDRIIQMFFSDCDQDDERINFRQFMKVLATFRSTSNGSSPVIGLNQNNDNNNANTENPNVDQRNSLHLRNKNTVLPNDCSSTARQQLKSHGNPNREDTEAVSRAKSRVDGLNEGLRNKLLFVFKVYDADNDGRISFNDLKSILKMMVGNYIEEVQLDKIATRAFVEVDEDNDGFIEFQEFCKVFSGKDLDDKLRIKFFN